MIQLQQLIGKVFTVHHFFFFSPSLSLIREIYNERKIHFYGTILKALFAYKNY